jgi:hypothetical protein
MGYIRSRIVSSLFVSSTFVSSCTWVKFWFHWHTVARSDVYYGKKKLYSYRAPVAPRVNAAVVNPRRDRHVLGPQPARTRVYAPTSPQPARSSTGRTDNGRYLTPSRRGTPRRRETPYNKASLLPAGGKAKRGVASEPQQSRDLSSSSSYTSLSPPSPRRSPLAARPLSPARRIAAELPLDRPPACQLAV